MIKRIQSAVIESNFFVALGVWSLVKLTGVLHSIDVDFFAFFSFVSTLLVYSFSVLFSSGRNTGFKKLLFSKSLLVQKIIFILSSLMMPFFLVQLKPIIILGLIPVALVSFLYPVEVVKEVKKSMTLREFPYLKIFLIGISWGIVTVVLPLINKGVVINYSALLEGLIRAMFVIAITIPFDVRDVNTDPPNMKTIPQKFGVSNAKLLAYLLLLVNLAYYFFVGHIGLISLFLVLLTLVTTSVLVKFSNSNMPKYYYAILMESTSIMLFLSFYISF